MADVNPAEVHYMGNLFARRGTTACGINAWHTGLVIEDTADIDPRRIQYTDNWSRVTCSICAARTPFRLRAKPLR